MKKTKIYFLAAVLFTAIGATAQVKIGNNPNTINASSLLEMETTNKGMLMPRVALTDTASATPLSAHVAGMVVYNTATAGNVTPGYYYNNGTVWVRILGSTGSDAFMWKPLGNASTVDGTHFIGTTDNINFNFRVNNQKAGRLGNATDQNVFYGYQAGNSNTVTGNHFIGYLAGFTNTTGESNTANGYRALYANTTGFRNTANGFQSLDSNTTGVNNTANGYRALFSNTSGSRNTANGVQALLTNTTGSFNTANGFQALYLNTTGFSNTANGNRSLYTNSTGIRNTANGDSALYFNNADNNTASGYQSLYSNTTGSGNTANGYRSLYTNSTGSRNTANGDSALYSNSTGSGNTANGYRSLYTNSTGSRNTANGDSALYFNNADNNTASGYQSLYSNTTGNSNTANGVNALYSNTTGFTNTANGHNALYSNTTGSSNTAAGSLTLYSNTTATQNVAFGKEALYSNNGNNNMAIGFRSMYANTTGIQNVASGNYSLSSNTTGSYNTATGSSALDSNTVGNYNLAAGFYSFFTNKAGSNGVAIGYNSQYYANNTATPWDNTNTSIGTNSLRGSTTASANTGTGNTAIGRDALYVNSSGNNNMAAGYRALWSNTTGSSNTANGYQALYSNVAGSNATALGYGAMYYANSTATPFTNYNVAVGYEALRGSTIASANTGTYNTVLGYQTLWSNTSGNNNTVNGYTAGYANTTGNNNTLYGYRAGNAITTGSNNLILGYDIDAPVATSSNQMSIGNLIFGNGIDGTGTTVSSGAIGIGLLPASFASGAKLDLRGHMSLTNAGTASELRLYEPSGSGSNYTAFKTQAQTADLTFTLPAADGSSGQVLSTNGTGTLSWATAGSGWALGGNTSPASNIFGTLSATDIDFRTTNVNRMTILSSGNVGIANVAPSEKLDVTGNIRFSGALMPNNTAGTSGQYLQTAGAGVPPIWTTVAPGSGWGTSGNAATNPTTNYAGTSDNVDFVLRANAVEQLRVIPAATNVGGKIRTGNSNQISLTRSISASVGNWTEIGNFVLTGGVGIFHISISTPDGGTTFSVSKSYIINAWYNATNGAWFQVKPGSEAVIGANDFELDFYQFNTTCYFRIRKTAGGATATAYVVIKQEGTNTDVFTPTATISSGSAVTGTIGNNDWSALGNSGTSASTNFIGTTDNVDFVTKANNVEQMRVIPAATNVGGKIRTGNSNQISLTRSISASVGIWTEIGNFVLTGGVATFHISISTPDGGAAFSVSKSYIINAYYNATNGAWFQVQPGSEAVIGANDFELDFYQFNTTCYFRIRKTVGGVAATAYVVIKQEGTNTDVFNPTAAISSGSAVTGTLGNDNWSALGNTGTSASTNFIGTTDNVDFVTRVNNVEQMRVIPAATNVGGKIRTGNSNQISLTRSISATVGNWTEIGNFVLTGGVGTFHISISTPDGGATFSVSKSYIINAWYNATNGAWFQVQHGSEAVIGANDFELDFYQLNSTCYFRIRKTVGTATATGYVVIKQEGTNTDVFNPTAVTSSGFAVTGTFGNDNWSALGNSGTSASTNFVGTTDNVDFVTKVNNIEQFRVIPAASNVGGKIRSGNSNQFSLTRTISASVGTATDIGNFVLGNGTGTFHISISTPADVTAFSVSKSYIINTFYNATAGFWYLVQPVSESVIGANDFELDFYQYNSTCYFRIRKTVGIAAGTAYVVIKQEGNNTDVFNPTTTTTAGATVTGTFGNNDWSALGNSGTSASTNFVGTTDNVDFVTKVNNIEQFRVIPAATNVGGKIRTGNFNQISLTRAISASAGNATEIGNFVLGNGTGTFHISISTPADVTAFSVSKSYIVNAYYNATAGAWYLVQPVSESVIGANDYELDFYQLNSTCWFRIRKTVGVATGTAYVVIKQEGLNTDAFTPSATVAAASVTGTFGNNDWSALGNSGTSASTNFVGTTDNVDFVTRVNNIEEMRVIPAATNVGAKVRTGNSNQISLTRAISASAGNATEIGNFVLGNGTGTFHISISTPADGTTFSVSKSYIVNAYYNATAGAWYLVQPVSESVIGANDYELDFYQLNSTCWFRIRKTVGGATGTAYVVIKQEGLNTDAFTPSATVYAASVTATLGNRPAGITKVTVTSDVASVAANSSLVHTFTVTGAVTTSSVVVSPQNALADGLIISYARVSAAGTVEVKFRNETGSAIDPASMNWYITVIE